MQTDMQYVGHFTFKNKEKDHTFFGIQALFSEKKNDGSLRSNLITIYVTSEEYSLISALDYGAKITVESIINYSTGKVVNKIIL